jgi:pyridinium-3,5-bisthiocarboxylic acid mononucleotide nickel chelatase
VLATLMDAGASDAWLTPILMKKGRPAHTLSVLCPPALQDALAEIVLTHTTAIGLRRQHLAKLVLDRETVEVDVDGGVVRVKVSRLHGRVVTATPEFDDVARLAREHGVPEKTVLAEAIAAASTR